MVRLIVFLAVIIRNWVLTSNLRAVTDPYQTIVYIYNSVISYSNRKIKEKEYLSGTNKKRTDKDPYE